MGTTVGRLQTSNMKLLVLSSVFAAALGAPEAVAEADADAYYGQYQWPGAYGMSPYGHGFSSTCYGCRPYGHFLGKRSADAEADADVHYGGVYGLGYGGLHGLGYARGYGYGPGIAHHGSGHSYVHQGIQGLGHYGYGKREAEATPEAAPEAEAAPAAEADADAHYGYYGYGHGYGHFGKRSAEPHGVVALAHPVGVAGQPGLATSYVGRTVFGYPGGLHHHGKRSAEAEADAEAD